MMEWPGATVALAMTAVIREGEAAVCLSDARVGRSYERKKKKQFERQSDVVGAETEKVNDEVRQEERKK